MEKNSNACTDQAFQEQLTELARRASGVNRLASLGVLVRQFCEQFWDWDALFFSARRGRGSFHFRAVMVVDTVDDEKVLYTGQDLNLPSQSKLWAKLAAGESVLINRQVDTSLQIRIAFGDRTRRSESLMFVPILCADYLVGTLSLQSYTPGKFEQADIDRLAQVGAAVAASLVRCNAEERVYEFMKLGRRLNKADDARAVAGVVAETAADMLGWDVFSIHLQEPASVQVHRVLAIQRHEQYCTVYPEKTKSLVMTHGLMKRVFSGNVMRICKPDIDAKEDDPQYFDPFGQELPLLDSFVVAPIRSLGDVIGFLCLQTNSPDAYAEEEEQLIAALADYCSGALERAWARQNLERSEENHRLLVDNVNDGIVISQDDHFGYFNQQFADMLGYDPAELRQLSYKEVYTKRGLEILSQRSAFRQAGIPVPSRYETLFRTKDGNAVPVEANVRVIDNFHGRPATFAVIRDISERKEAEKKLFESEQELRALFAAMTDVILILDVNGRCLNRENSRSHLRYTVWESLLDSTLFDVFPEEKADYLVRLIQRAVKSRQTLNVEFDLHDGEKTIWYNATVSPLGEDSVLMVARDVTERRMAEEELFRSNARYKALLDGSEDYIFVLDKDLRFLHVNSVAERRFHMPPEHRIGHRMDELFDDRPLPDYIHQIRRVFETGKPIMYDDDAIFNGQLICTETVVSPVFSRTGEVEAVLGISRDVTSRRQSAIALKRSEQRYAGAARATNDGIWDWNLETDTIYLSPRWWAILGQMQPDLEGEYSADVWFDHVHPEDLPILKQKIEEHINGMTAHLEDEHRVRHVSGEWRWVLCRGLCSCEESSRPTRMAGSISDITDRKAAEELLLYGATHDVLTNLPNRAHFLKSLARVMEDIRAKKIRGSLAVLFLDLDRFKVVNDSLGHLAGDELIFETARRLERCIRPGDMVARMGGDEFTVLLSRVARDSDVTHVANRIIRDLSAPLEINGFRVQTTVSMGIAFYRPEYQQPDDLLRDADIAMYRAKAAGRNRYQIFDSEMHKEVMAQLTWEAELRQAVAEQQFVLYYQPIYRIADRKLIGFEALIRWNHQVHGFTLPGRFIDLAEETGLIVPIGWWALDQALRDCVVWNRHRPADDQLSVSVNISPRQFLHPNLLEHVKFLLDDTGASPSSLIVEVTENLLMEDSPNVAQGLNGLREMGVRLDLDDFGTGYSSLSFLRRFPLDMLKIDRSFIQDLTTDSHSQEIVTAILSLAQGMKLPVTAEGVETQEQLDFLVAKGCEFAQGFLFDRPLPAHVALQLVDKVAEEENPPGAVTNPPGSETA